jgi:uncharacterized protein (TIGR03435 family)
MSNPFVGVFLVACLIGALPGPSALAQQQTPRAEFEVAVIKPARAGAQGNFFEIAPGGERFTATNAPLRVLIMMAYGVADWQVSGGPGWMNSTYFDIEAKPEHPGSREQIFQMLRSLLSDRFQLKLHKETREVPVYILAAAGKAYGLHENRSGDNPRVEKGEKGQIVFHSFPMAQLARYLSLRLRHEVTDKTMLPGSYDFELLFTPDMPSPSDVTTTTPPGDSSRPSLPDAVEDQLGLRLQLQKALSDALIIDAAVQPTEN